MRSVVLLAFALLISPGCGKPKPTEAPGPPAKRAADASTLPWSVEEAKSKLVGMSKEDVIATFGKPSEVWSSFYYYDEPKYLKPDIGDRDQQLGGMALQFEGNSVAIVMFRRK